MKKKVTAILFFGACAFLIGYGIYQDNELIKNRTLVFGEIKEVRYTSKSGDYFVTYHFRIDDKIFTAKSSIPYAGFRQIFFVDSLLKGKPLPVIYQADNPNNSTMLLTGRDYERYKVQIPSNVNNVIRQIDSLINSYH